MAKPAEICRTTQATKSTKSEVDVLLKGVVDRSLVEQIKNIIDMVVASPLSIVEIGIIVVALYLEVV